MKNNILILAILITTALVSCTTKEKNTATAIRQENSTVKTVDDSNNQDMSLYLKAGTIIVKDPMLARLGVRNDSLETISLVDISKYTGFICPGLTTGFFMIKMALDSLYANGEIPERGQIQVATSRPSDLLNVASYITGARGCMGGRSEINKNDIHIDTTLKTQKGVMTMIFRRKDNGKMVKAVFNKNLVLKPEDKELILGLKEKVFSNHATPKELEKFRTNIRRVIKDIVDNGVYNGTITISNLIKYQF